MWFINPLILSNSNWKQPIIDKKLSMGIRRSHWPEPFIQQCWRLSVFFFSDWNHCLICNIKPHKKNSNIMKFVKTNIVNSWQAPSIWDLDQHWTWRMTKHGNRTNWKRVMPLFIPWKQALRVLKHRGIRKLRCSALKMQPLLKLVEEF